MTTTDPTFDSCATAEATPRRRANPSKQPMIVTPSLNSLVLTEADRKRINDPEITHRVAQLVEYPWTRCIGINTSMTVVRGADEVLGLLRLRQEQPEAYRLLALNDTVEVELLDGNTELVNTPHKIRRAMSEMEIYRLNVLITRLVSSGRYRNQRGRRADGDERLSLAAVVTAITGLSVRAIKPYLPRGVTATRVLKQVPIRSALDRWSRWCTEQRFEFAKAIVETEPTLFQKILVDRVSIG